jgi:sirohydrochlorin ferrochelatase
MVVKTAIIILFHGSRAEGSGDAVQRVIHEVRQRCGHDIVMEAFLQHGTPSLSDAIQICAQHGSGKIVIVPFFLQVGMHVTADIPVLVARAVAQFPGVQITTTDAVGAHPGMIDIVLDLAGNGCRNDPRNKQT